MKIKKPIILLEVLIALAIVSIAIIPVMSYPFRVYEKELDSLLEVELNRVYERAFLEMQKELAETILFDQISREPIDLPLGTFSIDLDGLGTFLFEASCKLKQIAPKDGEKETSNKLISCQISLKSDKKPIKNLKTVDYLLHISSTTGSN